MHHTTINIPEYLYSKLALIAAVNGCTVSDLMRDAFSRTVTEAAKSDRHLRSAFKYLDSE